MKAAHSFRADAGERAGARRSATVRDKVRYKTDEVLSRGTLGIILWLAALTLTVVVVAAFVLTLLQGSFNDATEGTFFEDSWQSLLRVIDPGTMGGDTGWARLIALLVTIAGIFLASALIGIIATGLDSKIADLQKGRSFVVEAGHTAIVGWSPRIFT